MTEGRGQSWENADPDIRAFVNEVVYNFHGYLGTRLLGAYLHGSLAMGCFRRAHSDIDLLLVMPIEGLAPEQRALLAKVCVRLSDSRPILGDLELSILTLDEAREPRFPTYFELHYSADWTERIRRFELELGEGEIDFTECRPDPDLTAHITVTRARGIALYGPPPREMFAPRPWRDYVAAVREDFDWIVEGENLHETPIYGTLNLCRTLQLMNSPEGTVASKEEGGVWGLANVPPQHLPIVEQALALYRSDDPVTAETRRTGGAHWDPAALSAFQAWARSVVAP